MLSAVFLEILNLVSRARPVDRQARALTLGKYKSGTSKLWGCCGHYCISSHIIVQILNVAAAPRTGYL